VKNLNFPAMNEARSIKQNTRFDGLPNFRNLGITLRILLISNGLALTLALLLANTWSEVSENMVQIAVLQTPIVLISLMLLWAGQPWLSQLSYWRGALVVNLIVVALTLVIYYLGREIYRPLGGDDQYFDVTRYALLSLMVCVILLMYFRLRAQVLSHALIEARLQMLRARIRPHFLFNSINAVLGIVRTQPKKAEAALEDMADLFRMAMADVQDLVPLPQEIKLCKQYLALEQLRMGERLRVDWQLKDVPDDVLIPPLLLQPLLENAVYHGIEPLSQGGCINIMLHLSDKQMQVRVENPCLLRHQGAHQGNKIALSNIRERLELLFDVEAHYQVEIGKDFYRVEIAFPYVVKELI
jgi:two-component system sensor histidine kinase AlgZ